MLSDGIAPEVVAEQLYTKSGASFTATGWRDYVVGTQLDERLIYLDESGVVRYPHTDKHSSTVALAYTGTAQSKFKYGPFGETSDSPSGYAWRYTGQHVDAWTGLYWYKAREYAPTLGRFLQADPAGFVDGPNIYPYVGNDPLNHSDSTGLSADLNFFHFDNNPGIWESADQFTWHGRYVIMGHEWLGNHLQQNNPQVDPQNLGGRNVTVEGLEKIMAENKYPQGMPIFVGVCEYAVGGEASKAAQLARDEKTYVLAGNGFVAYHHPRDGKVVLTVGSVEGKDLKDGKFIEFGPDGKPTGREYTQITWERRDVGTAILETLAGKDSSITLSNKPLAPGQPQSKPSKPSKPKEQH